MTEDNWSATLTYIALQVVGRVVVQFGVVGRNLAAVECKKNTSIMISYHTLTPDVYRATSVSQSSLRSHVLPWLG